LLATPDAMRITTPLLSRETTQRVLAALRSDVAEDKVRIDTPTQNLESYFLGVVQKARQAEAETSGATSGNRVAAYLRGDADAGSRSEKVLDRLTLPTAAPTPAAVAPRPVETVDVKKLEQLARPAEAPAPAPAPAPTKTADLSKANEKLSALTGPPK